MTPSGAGGCVIEWDGKPVQINKPHDARSLGIATVYQEDLALCDNTDVVPRLTARETAHRGLGPGGPP